MIFDKQNMYSDAQAVTATADSTNVIDLGAANMGKGEPIKVHVQVVETFADDSGTNGTVTVSLQDCATEGGSYVAVATTAAIVVTSLTAGYVFKFGSLPDTIRQFSKLVYTVANMTATAGKITAGLVLDSQTNG